MLPAKSGDCLLVDVNGRRILIDGGYCSTYHDSLKNIIHNSCNEPKIDLVVVSHIDRDHIEGIIELLRNKVTVGQVWFNSYIHLPKKTASRDLTSDETDILRGYVMPLVRKGGISEEEISGVHGMALSFYILDNGIDWNSAANGKSICIENVTQFRLDEDIEITILSPAEEQLSKLARAWANELQSKKWSFELTDDDRFNGAMEAFLLSSTDIRDVSESEISHCLGLTIPELAKQTAQPDRSVTNASSISFMINTQGKKLLFLADAHEDIILKSVDILGVNFFDAIKLSHHGSLKNASKLFEKIDGEYFLISTDGSKHDHPHMATIAKIISRPSKFTRKLVFNYPHKTYEFFNDKALMEEYNYSVELTSATAPIVIT